MANPYESQSASNYNSSPPPDDGSETTSNLITWAGIKTKLADPVKALADAINTAVSTAFGKIWFNATNAQSATYSLQASDQGKVIKCTNSITINLLAAATAGDGFAFAVFNAGTGTITLDPSSTELINGASTVALSAQYDYAQVICDGTGWSVVAASPEAGAGLTVSGRTLAVGAGSGIVVNADDVAIDPATQQNMEDANTTAKVVTPDRMKYHPGVAKAFVNFTGAGSGFNRAYNVSSITDGGVGIYTINFTNSFSDANYAVLFGLRPSTFAGSARWMGVSDGTAPSASACAIKAADGSGSAVDPTTVYVGFFGDM